MSLKMLLTVLSSLIAASFLSSAAAAPPPEAKKLFADKDWYKNQAGGEKQVTGKLMKEKIPFATAGRFNPYRLKVSDKVTLEVYVGTSYQLLDAFVGHTVTVGGKRVDLSVAGQQHREVWPAWIKREKGADEKR